MAFNLNISVSQFASLVGCSPRHVRALIAGGIVNAVQVGQNYKFHIEEVNQYIYSKENMLESNPIILTEEYLQNQLIPYEDTISTQQFADFFDITTKTARSIIKDDIPSIFHGRRGGYRVRKQILIDFIIKNQTLTKQDTTKKE